MFSHRRRPGVVGGRAARSCRECQRWCSWASPLSLALRLARRLARLAAAASRRRMASLPGSPQGWVALSPPRTPVLRYHEVGSDARASSTDTAQCAQSVLSPVHATKATASPLASGRYAAARIDLSSQLLAMEMDMAGLETAAHRTFGSAVDRYHNLIVRRTTPKRVLDLKQEAGLHLNSHCPPSLVLVQVASPPGPTIEPRAMIPAPVMALASKTEAGPSSPSAARQPLDGHTPRHNATAVVSADDTTPPRLGGEPDGRRNPVGLTSRERKFAADCAYPVVRIDCVNCVSLTYAV